MKYFKKIIGTKVYLSPMNVEDAETYVGWLNDFQVSDGLGSSARVISLESEKDWIKSNSATYQFAIIRMEDDTLLGNCGVQAIDQIRQCAEVGLFIGEKENRNKGYGTEALSILLEYVFKYVNLNNVMLKVYSFNEIAIHCYQKIGFKEIGRRRQSYYMNGQFYDEVFMDILKDEYIKR